MLCLRNTEAQTKRPFPEASSRRRPRAQQQVVTNVKEHPHNPIPTRHGNAASIMPNKGHLRRPCCARGVGERRNTAADCNGSAHIRNQICRHAGLPIRASDQAPAPPFQVSPPIAGVLSALQFLHSITAQPPAGPSRTEPLPFCLARFVMLASRPDTSAKRVHLRAPCHGTTARIIRPRMRGVSERYGYHISVIGTITTKDEYHAITLLFGETF